MKPLRKRVTSDTVFLPKPLAGFGRFPVLRPTVGECRNFLMLTELQRPQRLFLVPPSAVRLFFRCPTKFSLSSSQSFLGAKYERGNICRPVEAPSCSHTGCTSQESKAFHLQVKGDLIRVMRLSQEPARQIEAILS